VADYDIIVIGASAGGVEALQDLVGGLPPAFPAALFVVLHLPATAHSVLPAILARAGPLPALQPVDGTAIRLGQIVVAPPNQHLELSPGRVRLTHAPRENRVRPAADVLFRSAARAYGARVIGVVLSGTDGDGTSGLDAIRLHGGVTIAQDPADAAFPSMPASAIEQVGVQYVRPVAAIPALLVDLVTGTLGTRRSTMGTPADDFPGEESSGATALPSAGTLPLSEEKRNGRAAGLTCPDCAGPIWELAEGQLISFECRVGHRYSPASFLEVQAERVENALWTAVNVLQERAATLRQLAQRVDPGGRLAAEYQERAQELDGQAATVRAVITELIETQRTPGAQPA
jgi:two-component system chemotaxis response regulator CheB